MVRTYNEKGRRIYIGGDGCAGEEIKGGPKQRRMDIIKDDLTEEGLSGEETQD